MMAAEQWYQHQENYQKYGLDMKPKTPRKKPKQKKKGISPKDKMRILGVMAAAGMICIGIIIATAFGATVQYKTNQIIAQNHEIEAEIESLTVKVHTANNIEAIETKATEELGMVYPGTKQIRYLTGDEKIPEGFAQKMKEQAYK